MPPELVAIRGSILRQLVAQSSGPSNSADRLKGCRISEILLESEGKDVTKILRPLLNTCSPLRIPTETFVVVDQLNLCHRRESPQCV